MIHFTSKRIILVSTVFLLALTILVGSFLPASADEDIEKINSQIKNKQSEIDDLRSEISEYESKLNKERSRVRSLASQITILETQIKKKEAEIELNQKEIKSTNLSIEKTEAEIKSATEGIADKEAKISRLLRELYRSEEKNDLEILILNNSISDFFQIIQANQKLQNELTDYLQDYKALKDNLEDSKIALEKRKIELEDLEETLIANQESLEDQSYTKQFILNETKSSERRYASLVSELKSEQARIDSEITSLEKTLRQKLSGGDSSKLSELGDATFAWPVPSQYVTATFHDPDYPFRHIFEHPAIDIRASQGTPLRASASGYVAKVKDGGKYGYSYIMLIHNDGFSTVYGHVSAIHVKTDQFVTQGEVIGATGGMPGTPGAGRMTTGPHLHFELRKNGIPVNPLDYLP